MPELLQLWAAYAAGGKAVADLNRLAKRCGEMLRSCCETSWKRLPPAARQQIEQDDLLQAGGLALAKALEAYDPLICPSIEPYLVQRINWALIAHVRKAQVSLSRASCQVSLETIVELPSDDCDPESEAHRKLLWAKCMAGLSDVEATVIRLRYQQDLTFDQIGERIHRSGEQARRVHNEVLERLRSRLQDQEDTLLGRRRTGSGQQDDAPELEEQTTSTI